MSISWGSWKKRRKISRLTNLPVADPDLMGDVRMAIRDFAQATRGTDWEMIQRPDGYPDYHSGLPGSVCVVVGAALKSATSK